MTGIQIRRLIKPKARFGGVIRLRACNPRCRRILPVYRTESANTGLK